MNQPQYVKSDDPVNPISPALSAKLAAGEEERS